MELVPSAGDAVKISRDWFWFATEWLSWKCLDACSDWFEHVKQVFFTQFNTN